MSGTWSKLKKTLSFKASAAPEIVPNQSDSRSAVPRSPPSTTTSSSLSSRFSRSFGSNVRSSKKTCAICLGNVRSGQGQAIFTAECSHSFHFSCIADSVKHGNYLCPICRFKWKEIPLQLPNANADGNRNATGRARVSPYQAPQEDYSTVFSHAPRPTTLPLSEPVFSDDEPLLVFSTDLTSPPPCGSTNNVSIKTFTEFPAVTASESFSNFAVLVGIHAPPLLDDACETERAHIDLVTVLDVSGSMAGSKLTLLKRAVNFVIDNLGSADRLSIVTFSANARRIFPLRRMTNRGREDARVAVSSLHADGGTNIVEGLKKGARVLEERRERNSVASIILLSDGKDTYNCDSSRARQNQVSTQFLNLLPISLSRRGIEPQNENQLPTFPIHTFGFGSDHDSSIMHSISDASGGTFSFIESVGMVQDAFARCIGGLLSVVVQEFRLSVTSASPGVQISLIPSGRYASEIYQGFEGVINVGDLYADEEKEFLVYLSVPICPIPEDESNLEKTQLLKIACSYKDASKAMIQFQGEIVEIVRPKVLSLTDYKLSLEVDRQRNRLQVAESIAQAQEMAERGNLDGAQNVLTNMRSTLLSSASAQAGDALCTWLEAELTEIREKLANMEMYEHTGRAYVLSGLSSHSWQRATTRGDSTTHTTIIREGESSVHSGSIGYNTPSMVTMVTRSQNLSSLIPRMQGERHNKSTSLTKM